MSDTQALARRVDAAAAAVDGIVRVYSAAPAVIGLVKSVLPADSALSIVRDGDPLVVEVSVGVDAARESSYLAQQVASDVRAALGAEAIVHVRVSRVVRVTGPDTGSLLGS